MAKKVKVYGFKKFAHYDENITEKILEDFGADSTVLDVEYFGNDVLDEIFSGGPDYIIGLGQCPASMGKKLRVEKRAVNWKEPPLSRIEPMGKEELFPNLDIGDENSIDSSSAGRYICNYSMYRILDRIEKEKLGTKYAFIHVPEGYDIQKARALLQKYIDRL